MEAVRQLSDVVGKVAACRALVVPRGSFYRWSTPKPVPGSRPRFGRALGGGERNRVVGVLHSPEFVDRSPWSVYAALLDVGVYLCSVSTMYRLLREAGEVRERRSQLVHPRYRKPELLARGPNEVWTWDITKLRGPVKWTYYYLYVMLDLFSRYVVGWLVAGRQTASLARRFIAESCERQGIEEGELTIHADRGGPMQAKTTAQLLADLGIVHSHSRPHVSNDNPFSEAQFKTLKYRPEFPGRFGSQEDAVLFCRPFFRWYNEEHYHSGIAWLTPASVHYGKADEILSKRKEVLEKAWATHPERFVRGMPQPRQLPEAVWINPPPQTETPPGRCSLISHEEVSQTH
jgi:putative transposase